MKVKITAPLKFLVSRSLALSVLLMAPHQGFTQSCTPPVTGLISWWQAESNALDFTGNANGSLSGNVTYTTGKVGKAFTFNGIAGSAVSLGNNSIFQIQDLTIEAWVQRSSTTMASQVAGGGVIFGYGSDGYNFGLFDNGVLFLGQVGSSYIGSTITVNDTNFHHLAVTKSGTNVAFYIDGNGSPVAGYGATFNFHTAVAIGALGDNLGHSFLGAIDEIAIYNRALSQNEIQSIYSAGSLGKCIGNYAPIITLQPLTSQTALAGTNLVLTVIGAGTLPLTYNWYWQSNKINGATNYVLPFNGIQSTNAGNYQVVITNNYGSVTSQVATVIVAAPPTIGTQPSNQTIFPGANAVFAPVTSGSFPLYYQWQLNGSNISGANQYVLVVTNAQLQNYGLYQLIVTNAYGATTSTPATLSLLLPPAIITQPQSQTNYVGGNASFGVTITNYSSTSAFFQWRLNGSNIISATNSTLNLTKISLSAAGNYSVQVTNLYGSALSSNAMLILNTPSCDPLPAGLLDWWQAEGNANDSFGHANGTIVGNVGFAPGEVGQSFVFSGFPGNGVSISNYTSLQLQDFSIEAWVQRGNLIRASQSQNGGVFFGYPSGGFNFGMFDNGAIFLGNVGGGYVAATNLITDTNFHHLAVTKISSNVVFYIDGAAYSAPPFSTTFLFASAPAIGSLGGGYGNCFAGRIDEISIYNRSLTAAEIQSIYESTIVGKCGVALSIVDQSTNQIIPAGSNITLNATVVGSYPMTYQWFQNGVAINGATNAILTLKNANFFATGIYSVSIANSANTIVVSNILLTVVPPPLMLNGSFETGNFAGWITNDLPSTLYPITVRAGGNYPGFGFFVTSPSDGNYCATVGWEGNGPGKSSIAQDVILPPGKTFLTFDYRAAWDMSNYSGSTLSKTFNVTIQPYHGGIPLHTFPILTAAPHTVNLDSGPLSGSLDLTPYSGQPVRISFDLNVPEAFAGPGYFQLDHIAVAYSFVPPITIGVRGSNVFLSWPVASSNYSLQFNTNLFGASAWTTLGSNVITHGATNTSVLLPKLSGQTYYRLSYP